MLTTKLPNPEVSKMVNVSLSEMINKIGAREWVVTELKIMDELTGQAKRRKIYFSDLNNVYRNWIQTLLINRYPYTDALGGLAYPFQTLNGYLQAGRRIIKYLKQQSTKKRQLKNWDRDDLANFLQHTSIKPDGTFYSYEFVRMIFLVLQDSYSLKHKIDGISVLVNSHFFKKVCVSSSKSMGINFHVWTRGNTLGLMPCSVATLLMADAIRTIRSKDTKFAEVYFESLKSGRFTDGNSLFQRIKKNPRLDAFTTIKLRSNQKQPNTIQHNSHQRRVNFVKKLRSIEPSLTEFPFKSHKQLSDYVKHIWGACITILLALTGMRLSELHSIRSNQLEYREVFDAETRTWSIVDAAIYSRIIKTGGGLIAKRGLSPMGIEVFKLINNLSWIDKPSHDLLLFEPSFDNCYKYLSGEWAKKSITAQTLRILFKQYYAYFLSRAHESVRKACPRATPHGLRHFKAAFTLRKFDGAINEVEAAIRQEFRHHYHHTQVYTQNKLNEQEQAYVEQEFVGEFVRRILINDPNDHWVGPGAARLRHCAEKILDGQPIELLSIEEFVEFVEALNEQVHSLKLHSYGCCVVLNENIKDAKCGTKYNIVQTGDASSEVCFGCSNFALSKLCHEHEFKLNKQRWQEVADDLTLTRLKLNKKAQALLQQLDKLDHEMNG